MGRMKGRHIRVAAKQIAERTDALDGKSFSEIKAWLKNLGIYKDSRKELNQLAGVLVVMLRAE